jgi:hypothetical protein
MFLVIVLVLIAVAVAWWLKSRRALSRNERMYLRRRGYEFEEGDKEGPAVSSDVRLLGIIESLNDLTPYARQRAAEQLAGMCEAGKRDSRMFAPLVTALDDSNASVRGAVVKALASLGDERAIEALTRKASDDESLHVRAVARQALDKWQKE